MTNNMLLVVAAAIIMLSNGICAEKYNVGDDEKGWIIRSSLDFYSSWTAKHKFQVGDILVFNFKEGDHTVAIVSKEGYDKCEASGDAKIYKEPTEITLNGTGVFYFICTVGHHCEYHAQKFAIGIGVTVPSTSSPETIPQKTTTFFCVTIIITFVLASLCY